MGKVIIVDSCVDGHYLNLPVMSEAGEIVGMVDVLKLTYATLDQVRQHLHTVVQVLMDFRSTTFIQRIAKAQRGTSFGCLLTMRLSQWFPVMAEAECRVLLITAR